MSASGAAPTAAVATGACSRCDTPIEAGDLRCSICSLPTPPPPAEAPGTVRAQVLRCNECAAAISFSAEHQAPRCGFCGATMRIEQPVDPIEVAEVRVPFTVQREAATEALKQWLGKRGWFAPKDLQSQATVDSLQPLCWAAWIVNATADVSWAADSNAGSLSSAWAPHAGEAPLAFTNIAVPASRGLTASECGKLTPHYDLGTAVPVGATIEGEPPAMVESFDAQRSAARVLVQQAIEASAVSKLTAGHIPGTSYRNVHVSCLLRRQTTARVALPAWVLAYRYRGTPFRAVIHGQRPDVVIGESPTDITKVALVVLGICAVIATIIAIAVLAGR